MAEFDETILRRNHMALVTALTDFEVICALLEEANIFTSDNSEDILSNRTSRDRACRLITFVRGRFRSAFPWLCHALELTHQFHLLELLDVEGEGRKIAKYWGKTTSQEVARTLATACKVCHTHERSVILLPCNHLATCFACSKGTKACPVCHTIVRTKINGRL
jgi:hypothetical protein